MSIQEAFAQLIAEREITGFDALAREVKKLTKTRKGKESLIAAFESYLLEEGITDVALNWADDKIVFREKLFRNTSFRIQLTPYELSNRKLILGHRLMPFVHPARLVSGLHFFDEDNHPLTLAWEPLIISPETAIYFNLLPPYGLNQYFERTDLNTNEMVLAQLDLNDWLGKYGLDPGDQLLISPKDYDAGAFYLEKCTSRELAAQRLLDKRRDELLTSAIFEVLDNIPSVLPVDLTLFWAFAQMDPKYAEQAGTPFGPFISHHETLTFFHEGSFSYIQEKNFLSNMWNTAMEQALMPDPEQMGKAKDLEGILGEMGNSYTETVIKALFIQQLLDDGSIDQNAVFSRIFQDSPHPFFNNKQAGNFQKAFDQIAEQTEREWANRRLPLPSHQLLGRCLEFKVSFIEFLRMINNQLTDPENLDLQSLMQMQPLDILLDQLIEGIISGEEISPRNARSLSEQIRQGQEAFRQFRDDFLQNL